MANPVEALLILAGACVSSAAIGASFIFGVAMVCRWLEWAPVNTTVNISYHGPDADVGREQQP